MFRYILIQLSKSFRFLFFNVEVLYFLIYLYVKLLKPQLDKAWSLFHIRNIKNMSKSAKILGCISVTGVNNLFIEDHVRIGRGCFLFADGVIKIGKGTVISRNVTIYSGNHNINGDFVPYNDEYVYKSVVIGKGVWIGMNVCITPGVTIGDGAVIGMGSVISKDVPDGCIVVGSQQRVVKNRDMVKFARDLELDNIFAKQWPDK